MKKDGNKNPDEEAGKLTFSGNTYKAQICWKPEPEMLCSYSFML